MKFRHFGTEEQMEQLTIEQFRGLLKLESGYIGYDGVSAYVDEISVVMLCYDEGKRKIETAHGGRFAVKGTEEKVFEHEKNNLIAVVGKCMPHSKAKETNTQIAIFDKHMNPVVVFIFNSTFSVDAALEEVTDGRLGVMRRTYCHLTKESAERDFLAVSLYDLSNNSKFLADICADKLDELKRQRELEI